MKEVDVSSLEHTSWRCQYHVVFAPKYRRMEIYGKIKEDIGIILRKLCQQKGIEIIEAQACPDHIHMLISIPPKYSVSQIMGYLIGKSSLSIFDRHANLKYKYGNRHFWARGYFVDTVGRNKKAINGNVKKCAVGKHPKSEKHGNTAQFSEVERSGTQENCGGIGSGCRLRLRPLPVLRRRQSQRVARIDPNAVVVDKNIAENDRFDLFSR